MPGLTAVCTPNSHPHEDGRVEHGYQLSVLDGTLTVLVTVDLPDWGRFDPDAAGRRLADEGFTRADPWRPSGLGHMTSVLRTGS